MSKHPWLLPPARTKKYFEFIEQFIKDAEGMLQIQIHSFTDYNAFCFYVLDPELKPESNLNTMSFRTLFFRTYGYLPRFE